MTNPTHNDLFDALHGLDFVSESRIRENEYTYTDLNGKRHENKNPELLNIIHKADIELCYQRYDTSYCDYRGPDYRRDETILEVIC